MQITKTSPDDYINSLDEKSADALSQIDAVIADALPDDVDRQMWEGIFWGGSEQKIIGYGFISYTRSDKKEVEWFPVGLTQQKNYISLFLGAIEGKEYVAEKYGNDLSTGKGKLKIGKSSISFKNLEDIDLEKLGDLVKKCFELSN